MVDHIRLEVTRYRPELEADRKNPKVPGSIAFLGPYMNVSDPVGEAESKRIIKEIAATKAKIELLRAAFTTARAPIRIEDLVSLVGEILRIADHPDGNEVQLEYLKPAQLPAGYIDPVYKQWQRECVNLLWNEIVQLPVRQRVAVLLAARDDGHSSVILIFSEICIASIREIAQAVGMSANEFAQILPKLPLDDNAIGKHLGVDRRRVITSRLSARRRLVRRMKSTD